MAEVGSQSCGSGTLQSRKGNAKQKMKHNLFAQQMFSQAGLL
jgi:hypothetical protein